MEDFYTLVANPCSEVIEPYLSVLCTGGGKIFPCNGTNDPRIVIPSLNPFLCNSEDLGAVVGFGTEYGVASMSVLFGGQSLVTDGVAADPHEERELAELTLQSSLYLCSSNGVM